MRRGLSQFSQQPGTGNAELAAPTAVTNEDAWGGLEAGIFDRPASAIMPAIGADMLALAAAPALGDSAVLKGLPAVALRVFGCHLVVLRCNRSWIIDIVALAQTG